MNAFGEIALAQWLATEIVRDNIILHECIIMPNHIHGIIEIVFQKNVINNLGSFHSPSQTIGSIVRGYKIAAIKGIKEAINKMEEQNVNSKDLSKGESKSKSKDLSKGDGQEIDEEIGKEISMGEGKEIGMGNSKGELQFAPTTTPTTTPTTAPISLTVLSGLIKSLDYKIWQRNYYEHIIRNEKAYTNISNYIINNPANWKEDKLK